MEGHVPWIKGRTASDETRQKLIESHKGQVPWNKGLTGYTTSRRGQKHSEETKRKLRETRKNQIFTDETRQKMSESSQGHHRNQGRIPWNKGLTKETDPRVRKYGESQRKEKIKLNCLYCGKEVELHPYRAKSFKFCSKSCRTRYNPPPHKGHTHSEETKTYLSKIKTEQMKDPDLLRRCLSCRTPNTWEERLIDLFKTHSFPFKFVGDGSVNIGGKNPDFIDDQGRIIEFFGEYWHEPEEEEERIGFFASYGYPCLVVWGRDYKDEKLLIDKIKVFSDIG